MPAIPRAAVPAQPAPPASKGAEFSYPVRSGDSLGSIAGAFGLDMQELARANHIDLDTMLQAGKVLRIPNPFAAEVRRLKAQVDQLRAESGSADEKAAAAAIRQQELGAQVAALKAENKGLAHGLRMLPWWHGTAVTAAVAALLMLGITLLTLFEWWLLRRRFGALAELSESLARLDNKYRALLAKAELRFQQLYGRRRKGAAEGQERGGKTPEEIEIERLNHELKEALETHLRRLGIGLGRLGSRARWREVATGVGSPVEARSARR